MTPLRFLPVIFCLSLSVSLMGQVPNAANPAGIPSSAPQPKALSGSDKNAVTSSMENVYLLLSLVDWQANTMISSEGTLGFAKSAAKSFNALWKDLAELGTASGLSVPVALSGGDNTKLARLRKETGVRYEKGLLEWISKETRRTHTGLETASRTASDPRLKQLADKWAPLVKEQWEAAETAGKTLGKAK